MGLNHDFLDGDSRVLEKYDKIVDRKFELPMMMNSSKYLWFMREFYFLSIDLFRNSSEKE